MCFNGQNCLGCGSGGVAKGNTGGGPITQFDIDEAVVRDQPASCSTGSLCSHSASGIVSTNAGNVPEPGTWVMLGGGLVLLSAIRRARI